MYIARACIYYSGVVKIGSDMYVFDVVLPILCAMDHNQ